MKKPSSEIHTNIVQNTISMNEYYLYTIFVLKIGPFGMFFACIGSTIIGQVVLLSMQINV